MALFYYTVPYIALLSVVVFFHELGHFLVGRWCGAKVDVFSLGFGPELCHYVDRRGTRWRIAALPLGGYVKFHGDANAASVPDGQAVAGMPPEERAGALASLSVWRRAAIVAAGPVANFILAVVILAGVFHFYGKAIIHPQIQAFVADGAAAKSDLKLGDIVLAVNGQKIEHLDQVQKVLADSESGPVTLLVERGNAEQTVLVEPTRKRIPTWLGDERGVSLGIQIGVSKDKPIEMRRYPVLQSVQVGVAEVGNIISTTGRTLRRLIVGRDSVRQLSGPIGIAQVTGEVAQAGFMPWLYLTAILSTSIGLLNLFPIPLLDGGFLMFFAYEAIRGKALPEKAQMLGFRLGLTFVAVLSVFVAVNDVSRILFPDADSAGQHSQSGDLKKNK